jgi:hypothetical protein
MIDDDDDDDGGGDGVVLLRSFHEGTSDSSMNDTYQKQRRAFLSADHRQNKMMG